MALEGDGLAVDQHVGIAFHDDAIVMAGDRAAAVIADAGDGAPHDDGFVLSGDDLAAVAGGIAETNDAAHVSGPCGVMSFKGAPAAVRLGPRSLGRFIRRADHDDAGHAVRAAVHRRTGTALVIAGDQAETDLYHG